MQTLHALFLNPLLGLLLMAGIVAFVGSLAVAILSSFDRGSGATQSFATKVASRQEFMYVATIVVGLVLSVASGVLGTPINTSQVTQQVAIEAQKTTAAPTTTVTAVSIEDKQRQSFRVVYAYTYVIAGLCALMVFIIPTPNTHALVKQVSLTTVGFLGSLLSKL